MLDIVRARLQRCFERVVPRPIEFRVGPIPVHIAPGWLWIPLLHEGRGVIGRFKKRYKNIYNPRRWGGMIWMIEIGSRG